MKVRRASRGSRNTQFYVLGGIFCLLLVMLSSFSSHAQSPRRELLMVERDGCPWCVAWDREVAPAYAKSAEGRFAPLRRIDIADWRRAGVTFTMPPTVTPTFILVADGREIGRITGYPGADFFWGLLDEMIRKLGPLQQPSPPRDALRGDASGRAALEQHPTAPAAPPVQG